MWGRGRRRGRGREEAPGLDGNKVVDDHGGGGQEGGGVGETE